MISSIVPLIKANLPNLFRINLGIILLYLENNNINDI